MFTLQTQDTKLT